MRNQRSNTLGSRVAKRGVSSGGFSRSGLVLPLFVVFCPFCDFPGFSEIFPICSRMVRGFSRSVLFLFLGLLRAPTMNDPRPIWLDDRGTGQWKWMEEVPRRTSLVPLAFPCSVRCLIGVEAEGLLDYQGRAGIISIVRWNLRLVIFGVEMNSPERVRDTIWTLPEKSGKPPV